MDLISKTCSACQTGLPLDARFCHQCGKQVDLLCPKCSTINPPEARFCLGCGHPINLVYQAPETPQKSEKKAPFRLNFEDSQTLPTQLREAFCAYLSKAVFEDGEAEREMFYLDAFESRGFRQQAFEPSALEIAQRLDLAYERQGEAAFGDMEKFLYQRFEELYAHFLVHYVKDLLPHPLSPRILLYQEGSAEEINLPTLFSDYLQPIEERETIYTHAVQIPVKKLKNARDSFFSAQPGELPLFFLDQTLFGSGKEGLILSTKGLYWKSYLHQAAALSYAELDRLKRLPSYLEVNGIYLNINEGFNYKLLKLLQRLRALF